METQLYSMKNGRFLVFRINRVQPVSSPSATVVAERSGGGGVRGRRRPLQRMVRILLECILALKLI